MSENPKPTASLSFKNTFAVDSDVMETGKWFSAREIGKTSGLVTGPSDLAVKIRSFGSRASVAARAKIIDRLGYADGELTPDQAEEVLKYQLAEAVVADWRGADVPYSPEAALVLMLDPDFIMLRAGIAGIAANMNEWRTATVEASVKN